MKLKVLVACEESQAVCKAFRALGHEAFSCDLLDCSGGHPEWHIKGDCLEQLDKGWDILVAHPSCQYLATSGARWMYNKDGSINQDRKDKQDAALDFVRKLMAAPIEYIAIENPISVISTKIRKPDCIVNPWQFGDPFQKTTCWWLKNLPKLEPTDIVDKGEFVTFASGKRMSKWMLELRGNGHLRSKTFPGLAQACAEQWSDHVIKQKSGDFSPLSVVI